MPVEHAEKDENQDNDSTNDTVENDASYQIGNKRHDPQPQNPQDVQQIPKQPPINPTTKYTVKDLLKGRFKNGRRQIRIEWADGTRTWEPDDCFDPDMLEEVNRNFTKRGKRTLTAHQINLVHFIMVIFCLITVVFSPTDGKVIQRINYGVIFKEQAKLNIAQESWLHTFQIELPRNIELNKVSFCFQNTTICNDFNNIVHFSHQIHDSTEAELKNTIHFIQTLVPQTNLFTDKRNARALLPFIGSLSKGLFGTATMDDVNLLAEHINALTKKTQLISKTLYQHGDHLSSFMTLMDNRTSNEMQGIRENTKQIQSLSDILSNSMLSFQQSLLNISQALISVTNQGNILRNNLNQLQAAVQTLVEGRISPFLLPAHTLTHALHQIQSILTKSYPGFYLTHFHASHYYTTSDFIYTRNHSSLYITIRFPVSTQAQPLTLYKVISLPVPTNNSLKHATKLLDLPPYIAITYQHDFYVPLTNSDLQNCMVGSVLSCDFNIALTPTTIPNCLLALFNNKVSEVTKYCNFRFLTNHLTHDLIEVTPTSVLVYNTDTISLNCPDQQKLLPGCNFCMINLPCRCSLSTQSLFLSPRLVHCYNITQEISILHPVNLALLQEFFDESKLDSILADTLFSTEIEMKIPSFNFFTHNMSKILAADQESHLSLRKMATAAKKDETIFKTLAEPLFTGDIMLQPTWPDLNAILIFTTMGIASLSIFGFVFMFCKVRKMATALLVLQQISHSKTQSVPSFIYEKPSGVTTTSNPSVVEKLITEEFSWVHVSVILSTIILLFLVFLVYFLYKSKKEKSTKIMLEITSGGSCVTVPILSLSLCPSYYHFSIPSVQDVSISALPQCKMFVIWSSFCVTNKLTGQTVRIPTTIDIDIFTHCKIKKIINQPFNVYVLITHQGFASTLNPPAIPQSDAHVHCNGVNESTLLYPKLG